MPARARQNEIDKGFEIRPVKDTNHSRCGLDHFRAGAGSARDQRIFLTAQLAQEIFGCLHPTDGAAVACDLREARAEAGRDKGLSQSVRVLPAAQSLPAEDAAHGADLAGRRQNRHLGFSVSPPKTSFLEGYPDTLRWQGQKGHELIG